MFRFCFSSRFLSAAALYTLFSAPLYAASNIAVVNIQGVVKESTAAKSINEQMESKQKTYQADFSKREETLHKEEQELKKQKSVLAQQAFAEKAKAFESKVTELQKDVQNKKAMLDSAYARALSEIQKNVTDIITDMSKEKGFVVAIPTSQLLYAESSLDITADVLKKLNERLPKVEVKFTAPASEKKK